VRSSVSLLLAHGQHLRAERQPGEARFERAERGERIDDRLRRLRSGVATPP
jgi:hypothetical protein